MAVALKSERGFTLTELAVVGSLAAIALLIISLGCTGTYASAREAETKANLHEIATALERYGTDHYGIYPLYIFGGDARGWDPVNGCRVLRDAIDDEHRPPEDPLIKFGYLSEYPDNPFVGPGEGITLVIPPTGHSLELGDGDVRFGWTGEKMGNCLDDPRYLFEARGHSTRLQYTMPTDVANRTGVLREGLTNSFYVMGGYPLEGSNRLEGTAVPYKGVLRYWWPGNFFYRMQGDFFVGGGPFVEGEEYEYIWGWPYMRNNKYILGCYGYTNRDGLDVIRLTTKDGSPACFEMSAISGYIENEYYQDSTDHDRSSSHSYYNILIRYSNPEVFGWGGPGLMPQFPYITEERKFPFGAPDGFPDGIILVLVGPSGTDNITPSWSWQEVP